MQDSLDSLDTRLRERLRSALAHRYTIERELGRGGMGTVYLARDLKHSRHVALKVLHPDIERSVGGERFLREIRTAAGLAHPNIVPVYESGDSEGILYYIMPCIQGESLRARLARERRLSIEDTVRIAADVAAALDCAHTVGIIHRDIKPENILLPNRAQAVVTDFGLAHAVSVVTSPRLTATGMTVGSPLYMSPEQALADRDIDGRADVYSLGCVVFEMLAGRPPFTGDTAQSVIAQHVTQKPPELRSIRADVTKGVQKVISTAMEKRADDRFASAADFADALKAASAQTSRRAGKSAADQPGLVRRLQSHGYKAVLYALLIGVLGLAGFAAWRLWDARNTRAHATSAHLDHLAVLYFEDHSDGGTLGYLADGLTESLIHQLSQIGALEVVSENGVKKYRNSAVPLDSIASALNVGAVIGGSVSRSGDTLRVNFRLIDAQTGTTLRSEVIDRPWRDLFGLIDDVVAEVSRSLRDTLGRTIMVRTWQSETQSAEAWKLVNQAGEIKKNITPLEQAGDLPGVVRAMESADSLLVRAEAADPRWVQPPVARGWVSHYRAFLAFHPARADIAEMRRSFAEGFAHAERARRINPKDARPLELRGILRSGLIVLDPPRDTATFRMQRDSAQMDFAAAVALDTTRARAWSGLARIQLDKGQFVEAKFAAERAYRADAFLDDAYETLDRLFTTSFELGDDVEAKRWCDEMRRRFPAHEIYARCALTLLAWTDMPVPDVQQVWRLVDAAGRFDPPQMRALARPRLEALAAGVLMRARMPDSATSVLTKARREGGHDPEFFVLEAAVRTLLQEPKSAVLLLRDYLRLRPDRKAVLLGRQFRPLRDEPAFRELTVSATTTP